MDESLEDLQRRFLEWVESAEERDAEFGFQLWSLLVTHDWFETQLDQCVSALVRRWGGNPEDVKDIKQDVVLQLCYDMRADPTLNLDLERAEREFSGWLFAIIYNNSVDFAQSWFGRSLPVDEGADPDRVAAVFWEFEEAADFYSVVNQLPEPDRTAAKLRIQKMTLQEIAQEMHLTFDRVRTILARARQRLRRLL